MNNGKIWVEYTEKFGKPPIYDGDGPLSTMPEPPWACDDLCQLLADCLRGDRPATRDECARAMYFNDGWFRCPHDGRKDGKPVEIKARTFAELIRAVGAAERDGLFDAVLYD